MADVFLSYKKEERAAAEAVAAALRAASYSVWWDDDLTPRLSWDAEIEREIAAAKAVLVLWSPRAAAEGTFVRKEAGYALDHSKLVPAWIERCALPLRFRDVQTADLTGWDFVERSHSGWVRLLAWIAGLVGRGPAYDAPTAVILGPSASEEPGIQPAKSAQLDPGLGPDGPPQDDGGAGDADLGGFRIVALLLINLVLLSVFAAILLLPRT